MNSLAMSRRECHALAKFWKRFLGAFYDDRLKLVSWYLPKQLFRLIFVNNGFRKVYFAASRLDEYSATSFCIHLDFAEQLIWY